MSAATATPETSIPSGPYIGLTNFSEEHATLFFGRDAERKVLISNLRVSRLTLLHAESGVGKSSLLRAGVAARLRRVADQDRAAGRPVRVPVVFNQWRGDATDGLVGALASELKPFVDTAPRGDTLEAALSN